MNRVLDIARTPGGDAPERGVSRGTDAGTSLRLPPVSSEVTKLAQRLFLGGNSGRVLRSVLFTTVDADTEAASVSAETALALSHQTPASVCVVDGNLLEPSLNSWFGVNGSSGLSSSLFGETKVTDCVTQLRPNLWLLPAGPQRGESAASLSAAALRARLEDLRGAFDHVLVHSADIGPEGNVFALAPATDGVVVVVDAERTRAASARRRVEDLRAAHVTVLGAVLMNRRFPIPSMLCRRL
jgi:Mrp family chromosome partitioning ATPase